MINPPINKYKLSPTVLNTLLLLLIHFNFVEVIVVEGEEHTKRSDPWETPRSSSAVITSAPLRATLRHLIAKISPQCNKFTQSQKLKFKATR